MLRAAPSVMDSAALFCIASKLFLALSPDHEYIGAYYAKDIYTEEERILNYCEEFHSYPPEDKGKRDYNIIRDYNAKYKMIDGNIVRA